MAKQTVNIGLVPNDGTGDTLRVGGDKINDNFTEVYGAAVEPVYFYLSGRTFRIGVRDSAFVIDQTITALGFGGAENTDWTELNEFKIEP